MAFNKNGLRQTSLQINTAPLSSKTALDKWHNSSEIQFPHLKKGRIVFFGVVVSNRIMSVEELSGNLAKWIITALICWSLTMCQEPGEGPFRGNHIKLSQGHLVISTGDRIWICKQSDSSSWLLTTILFFLPNKTCIIINGVGYYHTYSGLRFKN